MKSLGPPSPSVATTRKLFLASFYISFFSPVINCQLFWMSILVAYDSSCPTESLSGSTVKELIRRDGSPAYNCCTFFRLRIILGQMLGQWVKKKLLTVIFPCQSACEEVFPY